MNMHADEKSDGVTVPEKRPNNEGLPSAEVVEGRTPLQGNGGQTAAVRTQRRGVASNGLTAVRQAARQSKDERFTALLHHITTELLKRSYLALARDAAPGIDGVTWQAYGENLEEKLKDLHDRVHKGSYRARPARRTYIPKPDGSKRPLSILCLEDKVVQQAVVFVLEAIYEADFLGFSYGFRPGRGQHDTLDALHAGIYRRQVNWVRGAGGYAQGGSVPTPLRLGAERVSIASPPLTGAILVASADECREPSAEPAVRLGALREPGTAAKLGAVNRVAERGNGDQVNQKLTVLQRHCRAGPRRSNPAGMQTLGKLALYHRGAALVAIGVDGREPCQALPQPVAERFEYPVELLLNRWVAFAHRGDLLVPELDDGLAGQCAHKARPAAEMVQDQRMRDAGGGGDVVQPQPFGPGARDRRLRRLEDEPARLVRRAADPLDPVGHLKIAFDIGAH